MPTLTIPTRNAARVFTAPRATDGDGVPLRRAFPGSEMMDLDPFLLLDQMGPMDMKPGDDTGFPPHPHRGFETVTYLLSGEFQHRDSWGNHGLLRPGDVQWMTAGSGLIHSELPGETIAREGGRLHGFQLWINLPRQDKMIAPRYQDTPSARIPVARNADGSVQVKVIAGEALGVKGVIETRIPILYLHVILAPGGEFTQPVPRSQNALAYVIEQNQVVIFDRSADTIHLRNDGKSPMNLLLIAGEPIGEPIARRGPFVMNTNEELRQAVQDYQSGKMGDLQ
jgi:redox-sensitive bicupin YhaK (pirin superfamily)